MGQADNADLVRRAIARWRDEPAESAGHDHLLDFRPSRTTSVEIADPDLPGTLSGLLAGAKYDLRGKSATTEKNQNADVLRSRLEQDDLSATLQSLKRGSVQEYTERGIWVLYLAFGTLNWIDAGGGKCASPLVLVPVKLTNAAQKLRLAEQDTTPNPVLAAHLASLQVQMPTFEDLASLNLGEYFEAVETAVRRHAWQVSPTLHLTCFRFAHNAVHRDLLDNEARIAAHPGVQALALGSVGAGPSFDFEPIPPERLDELAPAADTPLVLDADSYQRTIVAAALAGRSFVVDGAPGTGKSQTIANMIGALLHAGRSVLFVSPKAAALETVQQRLGQAGLGEFLLPLHSEHVRRSAVARSLKQTDEPGPAALKPFDREQLKQRQEELNAYAAAVNDVREPLGLSLHEVLGKLERLLDAPAVPVKIKGVKSLDRVALAEIQEAGNGLAGSWRPLMEGQNFLWRGVLSLNPIDTAIEGATAALKTLTQELAQRSETAEAFGLTRISDAAKLRDHLHKAASRPPRTPQAWLTATDLEAVRAGIQHLRDQPAISEESDPKRDRDRQFGRAAAMLTQRGKDLEKIASTLGLPAPGTLREAMTLLNVADIADHPNRPEPNWFTREGHQQAADALTALKAAVKKLSVAQTACDTTFTPEVLNVDIEVLIETFAEPTTGWQQLVGGLAHSSHTELQRIIRDPSQATEAIANLHQARRWKEADQVYQQALATHGPALGTYFQDRQTDLDLVADGLALSERALSTGMDVSQAGQVLGNGRTRPDWLPALARRVRQDLKQWRTQVIPDSRLEIPFKLVERPLPECITWLLEQTETGQIPPDLLLEAADDQTSSPDGQELANLLGDLYQGEGTDVTKLEQALDWVESMRPGGSPLGTEQAEHLRSCTPPVELTIGVKRWEEAKAELLEAFDEDQHSDLEDLFEDAELTLAFLEALWDDPLGREEWIAYQDRRTILQDYGLGPALDLCISRQLDAEQIPAALERSVLQTWVDEIVASDQVLRLSRGETRDALGQEYRDLDRTVSVHAAADIVRAGRARRPVGDRPDHGLAGLVKHSVKSCFVLSPLTVSQLLPSDIAFDVVIFDEAGLIDVPTAISCIYRGKSLVLVGDQQQLPPPGPIAGSAAVRESILDLARSAGALRSLTLRWHYRSRHEDLFSFSNAAYYRNRQILFPGAQTSGPDVGVELFPAKNTVPEGVVERVRHHYRTRPGLSLGVITFSEEQASGIETAVRAARSSDAAMDQLVARGRLDGFFAKPVELAQGDERDVIILAIDDAAGKTVDPKRLNVAITRARCRNEIVTSLGASGGGTELQRYLNFATNGQAGLTTDAPRGSDGDSLFAEAVLDVVREWGYHAEAPTSSAGNRIDLAVRHPDHPQAFILGIICDGPRYSSLKVARDRERLHDSVLQEHGWNIHRIWSPAWNRDRAEEKKRLRAAIDAALQRPVPEPKKQKPIENPVDGRVSAPVREPITTLPHPRTPPTTPVHNQTPLPRPPAPRNESPAPSESKHTWAVPYVVTNTVPLRIDSDPAAAHSRAAITRAIEEIVQVESPIHLDLLDERLKDVLQTKDLGPDVRTNITLATHASTQIRQYGRHLALPGFPVDRARTPTAACTRTIGQIHDAELAVAVVHLAAEAGSIQTSALVDQVTEIFGWPRMMTDALTRLDIIINKHCAKGQLVRVGSAIAPAASAGARRS